MDYSEILSDCDKIIASYKPQFCDPFKKNLKIYKQAKIIKELIQELDKSKKLNK